MKGKTMTYDEIEALPYWVATITVDGKTFDWGRFNQWTADTARELVVKLFPNASNIIIRPWKPELPKGQIDLPLRGGFAPVKTASNKLRRIVAKAKDIFQPWKQLTIKFVIKKLIRVCTGFFWTRPDGRQFHCKTIRSLIARIMDYDGHLLQSTLRKIH